MFCSFFKNIGLSIALFFSSLGTIFHKPKAIKPVSSLTAEQRKKSDFIIHKDDSIDLISTVTYVDIQILKELTIKEKIKEQELILKKLRKDRKAEKSKKKEEEYQQWKKDQKKVMDEIDTHVASMPKAMEIYGIWTLTDDQIEAVISNPKKYKVKRMSMDEPNDIFE